MTHAPNRSARRPRRAEQIFALASAVIALRVVDDELLQPAAGTSIADHPAALLVPLALAGLAVVFFPRLRAGAQSLSALVFAALALVGGGIAFATLRVEGLHGSVWSGLVLLPAGVALLVLSIVILWRARRRRHLLGILLVPLTLFFVVMPVGVSLWTTHKYRDAIGTFAVAHQNVTLRTSDGLRLSGWYVPSRNRAAIVIVHGGGGDRMGALRHASMLAAAGFGVLVYDARGRGESQGAPEAYGWTWRRDIDAAVQFLQHRRDVDRTRIGALGLSTGADVLVEYAAHHHELRAVVADGSTVRSMADARPVLHGGDLLTLPYWWVQFAAERVLSGGSAGPPLARLAAQDTPTRMLFIASSWSVERTVAPLYARAAHQPNDLWRVDADHTKGLARHPVAYTARVTRFFGRTLLR